MAELSRTAGNQENGGTGVGPYLAVVVSHLDPKYMGGLEVELLKRTSSGNSVEKTGQIVPVKYLSPFYGVTPFRDSGNNPGYEYTQKSYGWWAVPPDPGTKVLVIFAEGNSAEGYWIGCVQDEYMNFMTPGMASTSYNSTSTSSPYPVGEYNKRSESGAGRDATKFIKPTNTLATSYLQTQGLLGDHTRGTTTSSARREVPSHVFGISTPGPLDRRPGSPRGSYGETNEKSNVAFNRLGGSTFVMDDGDAYLLRKGHPSSSPPSYANIEAGETGGDPTLPHNDLVRLRTRTGHQILMHNSEDLIYICNSSGSTWIELTSNGKVDIYAADSVSIHSEGDINLKADKDVNIEAGANINLKAGADGRISTGGNLHLNSDPASPVSREPGHEPWDGHENLHGAGFTSVVDTFRKSS